MNLKFKILSSLILLLCGSFGYAQENKKRFVHDSLYIHTHHDKLSAGIFTISPTISIKLAAETEEAKNKEVSSDFRANISNILGFSLGYGGIHLMAGFKVASSNQKNTDYAVSKYSTFAVRVKNPVYYLLFRYSNVKGLTDVNKKNSLDTAQVYLKRGDISLREYQFEGIYNFGWKRYSYTAPLTFHQRQMKSKVGMLAKVGISHSELSADSALVTSRQSAFYDKFNDVQTLSGWSVKLAPGVGGNLILFKRIYFSMAVFVAYDLYLYKYTRFSDGSTRSGESFVVVLDGRTSLGFQSDRFYIGMRYEGDSRGAKLKDVRITTQYSYVGFEMGYRFNAPGFLKKGYGKLFK